MLAVCIVCGDWGLSLFGLGWLTGLSKVRGYDWTRMGGVFFGMYNCFARGFYCRALVVVVKV